MKVGIGRWRGVRVALSAVAVVVLLFQATGSPVSAAAPYHVGSFRLNDLAVADRYYRETTLPPLQAPPPVDSQGVPLFAWRGELYYHPVVMAQRALKLLDGYRQTGDDRYLTGAKVVAARILKESSTANGARYLPYKFTFALHNIKTQVMKPTWWSGMAQGQALSVFSRLYAIEGRQADLDVARTLFLAMVPHGTTGAWVSHVDIKGFLWIQEFPRTDPDYTLNGFIFALFGLYDYYLESGDPAVRQLLFGGMTTVRHYLSQFRNPGGISFYCLSHHVTSQGYHNIHVAQLKMLAKMTNAWDFVRYARLFDADA
jgi:hypothetical protein